jgi:hypothetical protein
MLGSGFMKKILGVLILSLLLSGNAYANNKLIQSFNSWLSENGYHQYLEKIIVDNVIFEERPPRYHYNNIYCYL